MASMIVMRLKQVLELAKYAKNSTRVCSQLTKLDKSRMYSTCLQSSLVRLSQQQMLQMPSIRMYSSEQKLTQSDVEQKVLSLFENFDRIKENPAKPKVTLDSHVSKDLSLDSLDHVEIIVQLEDTFGNLTKIYI